MAAEVGLPVIAPSSLFELWRAVQATVATTAHPTTASANSCPQRLQSPKIRGSLPQLVTHAKSIE